LSKLKQKHKNGNIYTTEKLKRLREKSKIKNQKSNINSV